MAWYHTGGIYLLKRRHLPSKADKEFAILRVQISFCFKTVSPVAILRVEGKTGALLFMGHKNVITKLLINILRVRVNANITKLLINILRVRVNANSNLSTGGAIRMTPSPQLIARNFINHKLDQHCISTTFCH
jgi:hypothetical protein